MDLNNKKTTARRYFIEILTKLTDKDYLDFSSDDFKKLRAIKEYISKYPDDEVTKDILDASAEYIKVNMLNLDFIKALYMSDNLKYLKRHKIFKSLPLMNVKDILFFNGINSNLEYYGNITNYYRGCFELLSDQHKTTFNKHEIEKIIRFVDENKNALLYTPQKYNDINEEIALYRKSLINSYTNDFEEFKSRKEGIDILNGRYSDFNDIKRHYRNKKISNIAEEYIFECIKDKPNAAFISRDLADGFGYDMYCTTIDNTTKEVLIEVKATTKENDDTVTLTECEYNTMIETLTNSNVKYIICLSYVDLQNEFKIQNILLEAKSITTLYDINNNVEYYMDYKAAVPTFKAHKEKNKQKQKKIN